MAVLYWQTALPNTILVQGETTLLMLPSTSTQKTIVITGCSTGFGRVTALHMARLGWRVFATVRKEIDQDSLRAEATSLGCHENLVPLLCDITNEEQVA